jgi:hypothetical protein
LSIAVLGEFVEAEVKEKGSKKRWSDIHLETPMDGAGGKHKLTKHPLSEEIEELVRLIEYRPGVLSEALMQRDNMLDYWRAILSFSRNSHPATFELARAALKVAQFMAVRFKRKYDFPRPSQLSPALMPPIDPPGHASYPSGHATESYLLSAVMKLVMPKEAHAPLDRMAERVARNREVLGLHYPRDSMAGEVLAERALPFFLACKTVTALIKEAKKEW